MRRIIELYSQTSDKHSIHVKTIGFKRRRIYEMHKSATAWHAN